MKKTFLYYRLALATALLPLALTSCTKDDEPAALDVGSAGNNAYVLNEGNYTRANAAVSLFNKATKALNPDIFRAVNQADLGDVVQSMTVVGNRGYVVVNNSNKIEVVGLPDFKSVATIGGVQQPRYLLVAGPANTAYVTEWRGGPSPAPYTAGRISRLDLTTNAVVSSQPTGTNPGRPVLANGRLYVPCYNDNTVSVFEAATGAALPTVALPSPSPNSAVADASGQVWVLCEGDYAATPGALLRLPAAGSNAPILSLLFAGSGATGLRVSPDGQQLYYSYNGAEYRMSVTAMALPAVPLIRRNFYGFDIDPATGILYGCNATDYATPGSVVRYQSNGTLLDSAVVKISPNGVVFY